LGYSKKPKEEYSEPLPVTKAKHAACSKESREKKVIEKASDEIVEDSGKSKD
jgi:hypothetical protein